MKTLEQIKNDLANREGFEYFEDILLGDVNILRHSIDELLILVQKEYLKNASKNANIEDIRDGSFKSNYDTVNYVNYGMWGTENHSVSVNKESITNENNIIK